jgi:predicted ATP-grasp superfamily ATP-dependent carboligase
MTEKADLILIGASVRAAAFSALRAGLQPWCADLFGDVDLEARCDCRRLAWEKYPGGFREILESAPDAPWMYTGGLENAPRLVDALAKRRPLWGNGGEVLRQVRSPFLLAEVLARRGIAYPRVAASAVGVDPKRRWLVKPRRSAGGAHIRFWQSVENLGRACYWQEFVEGPSYAAVYLGSQLVGVTRQLIGESWLGAEPFRYCGSIGPVVLEERIEEQFRQLGQVLVEEFKLQGIYGVDCVVSDGEVVLIEVNPRYTASVEVLEYAARMPLPGRKRQDRSSWIGKGILYAANDFHFPPEGPWDLPFDSFDPWKIPAFADIPHPGSFIQKNYPILTFFVQETTECRCWQKMRTLAEDMIHFLKPN